MIERMLEEQSSTIWATVRLEEIERLLDPATNAGGRVSSCTAQARAWLAAGQPDSAAASLREALRLSCGIGYHKDYQLSVLIPLLEQNWRADSTNGEEQSATIARSIHSLRHETHGGEMWDAAERLIETSFKVSPALGLRTWALVVQRLVCKSESARQPHTGASRFGA